MNLGSFAGGLAQGMQTGERIKLARAANSRADREMEMAENEYEFKQQERERARVYQDGLKAIMDRYTKPQEVEEPEPTTNEAGQTVNIMRKRVVSPDLTNTTTQMKMLTDMMAHQLKYKADPETLKGFAEYSRQMRETEVGDLFVRWASGDESALSGLANKFGFDPKDVKIKPDDKKGLKLVTPRGEYDMRTIATIAGFSKLSDALGQQVQSARDAKLFDLGVAEKEATTNLRGAQTTEARARANAANALAASRRAAASGTAGPKNLSKEILEAVKVVDPNPDFNPGARAHIINLADTLYKSTGGKMSPNAAVAQGQMILSKIDARIASMTPEERNRMTEQYGDLRTRAIETFMARLAGGQQQQQPASVQPRVPATIEDDEE